MELIINLDWLKVFYLVMAILILAMAIVLYPTLKYGPKEGGTHNRHHKSAKSR